jgi:transposase
MRKSREILRHKWVLHRSHREVAASLGVSVGIVTKVLGRAADAGLTWSQIEALSNSELEHQLYGPPRRPGAERPLPDPAYLHQERKKVGVTLELLHLEYLEQHPDGYRYTQFCEVYRRWLKSRGLSMRQIHRAGEKMFVDYSGKKPSIVDPKTGEVNEVELFVAVLGASNYTYAEATLTQRCPDFIASHQRAFRYFGGVTSVLVPDQLKSGVIKSCAYEPKVQRTYEQMAEHYDAVVIPARPRHPKDKAKVEVAVQVVQRWILARLRNQLFFSLDELNQRIGELLDELNDRRMKIYGASRRELFERLDKPALKPLPAKPFEYGEWKTAKVNIDYHIEIGFHYYSVPYLLRGEHVDAWTTGTTVEVWHDNHRVTSHVRSFRRGLHTTKSEHMPKSHQQHLEWTPSRLIHWGGSIGPKTQALVEAILAARPHPEQGYRSCLGLLRLGKKYGNDRLEVACERALAVRARSYRHVKSILKNGLDRVEAPSSARTKATTPPEPHENIRGADYYH